MFSMVSNNDGVNDFQDRELVRVFGEFGARQGRAAELPQPAFHKLAIVSGAAQGHKEVVHR
jgi:hypothetical protein